MSDRFLDVNNGTGIGRSPITKAGHVAYNGFVDRDAIKNRRESVKMVSAFYASDVSDESFAIFQHDVLLTEKARMNRQRDRAKASNPFVLSTLNGAGRRGEPKHKLVERFSFAGVSGSQGAKYDSTSTTSDMDIALDIGGLHTIVNTGPKRIKNGDLIWWDLPDPGQTEIARKGSERLVPITRPYEPAEWEANEKNIPAILMSGDEKQAMSMGYDSPLIESARGMKSALSMAMLLGIHVALSTGLVKLEGGLDDISNGAFRNDRIQQSGYARDSHIRLSVLEALAKEFGLESDLSKKRTIFEIDRKQTTTEKYATEAMSAVAKDSYVLPLIEGTGMLPGGVSSRLITMQRNLMSDLVAATQRNADYTRQRIFAKAITPADSGKEMDIMLGHYMA